MDKNEIDEEWVSQTYRVICSLVGKSEDGTVKTLAVLRNLISNTWLKYRLHPYIDIEHIYVELQRRNLIEYHVIHTGKRGRPAKYITLVDHDEKTSKSE